MALELHRITLLDAPFMHQVENDPEVWAYSTLSDAPYTREEIIDFIRYLPHSSSIRYVIWLDGQRIGFIDLMRVESNSGYISIIIYPRELRSKGYGSRAIEQLLELHKGYSLHAEVDPNNLASVRFFEKCGFSASSTSTGYLLTKA